MRTHVFGVLEKNKRGCTLAITSASKIRDDINDSIILLLLYKLDQRLE